MREHEARIYDINSTIHTLETRSKEYVEAKTFQFENKRKGDFMKIYEEYSLELNRATKEKNHTYNLLVLLKTKKNERGVASAKTLGNRFYSKTPPKTSQFLSSEKLRTLTKGKSKSPIANRLLKNNFITK